jgi:hypothetical protein
MPSANIIIERLEDREDEAAELLPQGTPMSDAKYATMREASAGRPWLFLDGEPVAPVPASAGKGSNVSEGK